MSGQNFLDPLNWVIYRKSDYVIVSLAVIMPSGFCYCKGFCLSTSLNNSYLHVTFFFLVILVFNRNHPLGITGSSHPPYLVAAFHVCLHVCDALCQKVQVFISFLTDAVFHPARGGISEAYKGRPPRKAPFKMQLYAGWDGDIGPFNYVDGPQASTFKLYCILSLKF